VNESNKRSLPVLLRLVVEAVGDKWPARGPDVRGVS